jgi:hypothetical protein
MLPSAEVLIDVNGVVGIMTMPRRSLSNRAYGHVVTSPFHLWTD